MSSVLRANVEERREEGLQISTLPESKLLGRRRRVSARSTFATCVRPREGWRKYKRSSSGIDRPPHRVAVVTGRRRRPRSLFIMPHGRGVLTEIGRSAMESLGFNVKAFVVSGLRPKQAGGVVGGGMCRSIPPPPKPRSKSWWRSVGRCVEASLHCTQTPVRNRVCCKLSAANCIVSQIEKPPIRAVLGLHGCCWGLAHIKTCWQ